MAKSVGKYTGIQYRPLQGDVTDDLLNAENQEFKHRAEQRLIADRKALAQSKKDKARETALGKVKHNKLFDTESDSLNQVLANTVKIAQQEYDDIFEVLENQDNHSLGKITQAQLKLDYLNNGGLVDDLKIMTSSVMKENQDYNTGVSSGTLFRDEDYEKKFEGGFKNVAISLDDNLRPVAIFNDSDQDGDGILDIETLDSLNDVYARPEFQKNFNYDSMVKKHSEKLVSAINTKDSGFKSTKTTGVEEDLLTDTVKRFLYNNDGTPTAPMKAFLRQKGMDENNPQHLTTIEDDYKNDIYLRTKRGKEEDFDGSSFVANKKENRIANEEAVSLGEGVTPTKETWGKQYGNIDTNDVYSIPVSGVKIDAIPLKDGRTITDANVVNYTYDKNDDMVIDVWYQDTKTETMTQTEYDDEMKKAADENDQQKLFALSQAINVSGGKKVTTPGQKKKEQITISDENESKIAAKVAGSIEEAKKKAKKPQKEEENTQTDEFGIPIDN